MATEPLALRILAGIIPEIKVKIQRGKTVKISMFEVLKMYTSLWIRSEIVRNQAEPFIKEMLGICNMDSLDQRKFGTYVVNSVVLQVIRNKWLRSQNFSNYFNKSDIFAAQKVKSQIDFKKILALCPVQQNRDGSISFIHKSILDYFLALLWKNDLLGEGVCSPAIKTQNLAIASKHITKDEIPSLVMLADSL